MKSEAIVRIHNPQGVEPFEVKIWRTPNGCFYNSLPRIGETIVITGIAYKVSDVVWDYHDEDEPPSVTVEAR